MDILIIGGTQFVGRHLVEAAFDAGHNVTLFNRGKTNPGIYPAAEEIHGDRDGGLDGLKGRQWDVVVDTSAYVPRIVRQSAALLRDAVEHYVFVSSISVYSDFSNADEANGTLHELEDPDTEEVMANYGGLKVACENVISEIYGERGVNVRAGFIVGNYDRSTRMPYLMQRFDEEGERIAGRPEQPVQFIHARDLGEWMLGAAEQKLSGAYNLTGKPVRMDTLLNTIVKASGKDIQITYTSDEFLQDNEVPPIDGLPYWVPKEFEPVMQVTTDKALHTGLKHQSLAAIVDDVLQWARKDQIELAETGQRNLESLIMGERERDLLAKWHDQNL